MLSHQMYLMIILLYLTGKATATQTFQGEPSDVTVNLGDNVTLPCKVSNRKGEVQWTRDDFGLGIDRQLSGFSRYKMLGRGGGDDFSLEIAAVSLEDDARFQCQVGAAGGGVGAIQSANATVTVQLAPDQPVITNGDKLQVMEGSEVEVTCKSFRGKPPAEVRSFELSLKIH
jgi:hypothetical protein